MGVIGTIPISMISYSIPLTPIRKHFPKAAVPVDTSPRHDLV